MGNINQVNPIKQIIINFVDDDNGNPLFIRGSVKFKDPFKLPDEWNKIANENSLAFEEYLKESARH
jgi:hypothetical protein